MDRQLLLPSFTLPGVRALVFDMGDVLYDASMWRRWLLQLLRRHGLHSSYHTFFGVWEHDYLPRVNTGAEDYWQAMRNFLRSAGLPRGSCQEIVAAGTARRQYFRASIRPLTGVRSALAALSTRGMKLAAVSNTPETAEALQKKLDQLGIGSYFATCLSSLDAGAGMPAATVYLNTLQRLEIAPGDAAFVGHDATELAGAQRAGLSTIAVNYRQGAVADLHLKTFKDLMQLPVAAAATPLRRAG